MDFKRLFKKLPRPASRKKCIAMYGCFVFAAMMLSLTVLEASMVDVITGQQQSELITQELNETYHTQEEKDIFNSIITELSTEPLSSMYRMLGILAGVTGAAFYIENRNNKKHQITLEKQGIIQENIKDTIDGFKDGMLEKLNRMEKKTDEEKHDLSRRLDRFEKNIYKDIAEKTNTVKDLLNERMKGVELSMKNLEANDHRHELDIQRLEDRFYSLGSHSHDGDKVHYKRSPVDTNKDI